MNTLNTQGVNMNNQAMKTDYIFTSNHVKHHAYMCIQGATEVIYFRNKVKKYKNITTINHPLTILQANLKTLY